MIRADHLCKTYAMGTPQETAVLKDASVTFDDGVFYAIIGKSGSGKSTLLNLLSGLDTPDSGQVYWDEQELSGLSRRERAILRRRNSGYIFQSYNLLGEHTVWENIIMPYILDGKRPDWGHIMSIADMLGIGAMMDKYPNQLSGGEQQRVAIARAVSHAPKVVFADEPTGNLDPKTGEKTIELLKQTVTGLGSTLILVTHDLSIADRADQIVRVAQGTVLQEGQTPGGAETR